MVFSAAKDKPLVSWEDVEYAVRRNFGGLEENDFHPVEMFMENLDGILARRVREVTIFELTMRSTV